MEKTKELAEKSGIIFLIEYSSRDENLIPSSEELATIIDL
jgi:hypothetical protein